MKNVNYAFGMLQPNRTFSDSAGYRFGFNGMEKVDEMTGKGNQIDYGERMYDPRISRWLSIDKLFKMAPNWSPYRYAFDNPIQWKDIEGNYEIDGHFWTVLLVATLLKNPDAMAIAKAAEAPDNIVDDQGKVIKVTATYLNPTAQKEIHALTGGDASKEVALSMQMLKEANTSEEKGIAAHRLGDSYSHAKKNGKMYPHLIGHGLKGHAPDKIKNDGAKYLQYVKSLTEGLGGKNQKIDMFAFNYIAKAGLSTEANSEILKSEVNLQNKITSFEISEKQIGAVTSYLMDRSLKMGVKFAINKEKDENGKDKTIVNVTYSEKNKKLKI